MNHKRQVILADAVCAVRPDWQQQGTIAQISILDANWTDTDAALAAHVMAVAANRTARTPAAFNAMPVSQPTRAAAPDDYPTEQPKCYICGKAKLDCQRRQDWEIAHGIPDPHVFETKADATANRAVRTDAQRADMTARIRTLFRSVNDELAAPLPPGRQPYLPPALAAESQARLELDEHLTAETATRHETHQPEQEPADA